MTVRVAGYDFDGTMADTFTPCPGGLGVKEAYAKAVNELFGDHAWGYYQKQGGLRNRAPRAVVVELLGYFTVRNLLDARIDELNEYLEVHRQKLGSLTTFPFPKVIDATNVTVVATELLVCCKLELLVRQMGTPLPDGGVWPKAVEGFADHWRMQSADKSLIVSSGHQAFIERFFELNELSLPDAMVTADDTRHLRVYIEKPDPAMIKLGLQRLNLGDEHVNMIYYGDDPDKDGKMALYANIPFYLVDPYGKYPDDPHRFLNWTEAPYPAW